MPDDLADYVEIFKLTDLIDFSRSDFTKEIKTTPTLSYPQIECAKYPSERLEAIAPYEKEKITYSSIKPSSYVTTANMLQNRGGIVPYNDSPEIGNITKYRKGDILVSNIRPYLKKIWLAEYEGGCSNDILVFHNVQPEYYDNEYLYAILSSDIFFDYMMVGKTGLKMPRGDKKIIPNFLIPKPDPDTQKKIIEECKEQDCQYKKAFDYIAKTEQKIEELLKNAQTTAHTSINLSREDLFDISSGKRVLKSALSKDGVYEVFSANVFEPFGKTTHSVLSDFSKPSVLWGMDGDWMVNYLESQQLFNPTDHCGVIRVLNDQVVNPHYLAFALREAGIQARFSRSYRPSMDRIKALTIMLPNIELQNEIAAKISSMEKKISKQKEVLQECLKNKQAVIDKYLK